MEIKAQLRYLRISPKKVRLVVNLVRGLKVDQALNQLNFLNKAAKKPVIKLINSAIANAETNFNLKRDNLFIKEIRVDMAGALKRWMPKAHGRATPILKRISHVILVLGEVVPSKQTKKPAKKAEKAKAVRLSSKEDIKEIAKGERIEEVKKEKIKLENPEDEKTEEAVDVRMEGKHRHNQNSDKRKMKGKKGFIKKIFNRKAG